MMKFGGKLGKGGWMRWFIIIGLSLVGPCFAGTDQIERWTCVDGTYNFKTTWTIAENRMFVAAGKGALSVAKNTSSIAIAYDLSHASNGKVLSYVYILDKIGHQLIVYDESLAVIFDGKFGQPFEPKIRVDACDPTGPRP